MLTVNALAHASPDILAGALLTETILPVLYEATRPDPRLIRVVDLGPFKHKIDDGLPLRKAAFQCLDTLLQVAPHRLNLREFMGSVTLSSPSFLISIH
jgi:cullin-associated NEDD8-dissociated protein 1